MPARRIPLFPLNVVLFPGMALPLHIFEPRYQQMIRRCLDEDGLFGVCLIDVGQEVRARTGKRGVTVVLDCVGTATWRQSLGALGRRGRLVVCGGTSGPMVEMDVRRLFWNQWSILGSTMGSQAEFDAVTAEFIAGRLTAIVDSEYPLERAAEAVARLASGQQFGKVVVRIS